jgi:gas vesicle protein
MSNNRSGVFIGGLVLGTAIGALTGLIIAPRTGRETRKLLHKSARAIPDVAEDLSTSVHIQADRISHRVLANWDETLERLQEAIAAGINASNQENLALQKDNILDHADSSAQHIEN